MTLFTIVHHYKNIMSHFKNLLLSNGNDCYLYVIIFQSPAHWPPKQQPYCKRRSRRKKIYFKGYHHQMEMSLKYCTPLEQFPVFTVLSFVPRASNVCHLLTSVVMVIQTKTTAMSWPLKNLLYQQYPHHIIISGNKLVI